MNYNAKTARKRVQESIEAVENARAEFPEIRAMVESIQRDGRLSESYREQKLQKTISEWRSYAVGGLQKRAERLHAEREQAEQYLSELREVAPEVMAARAAVLAPVLNKADSDPDALLRAYRTRFTDLADRQILEDSAELVQTAFSGAGYPNTSAFGERWKQLQAELAPQLPAAEREVISAGESFSETAGYLESATGMLDADLAGLTGESSGAQGMMQREYHRVAVQRFESAAQELLEASGDAAGTGSGTAA